MEVGALYMNMVSLRALLSTNNKPRMCVREKLWKTAKISSKMEYYKNIFIFFWLFHFCSYCCLKLSFLNQFAICGISHIVHISPMLLVTTAAVVAAVTWNTIRVTVATVAIAATAKVTSITWQNIALSDRHDRMYLFCTDFFLLVHPREKKTNDLKCVMKW